MGVRYLSTVVLFFFIDEWINEIMIDKEKKVKYVDIIGINEVKWWWGCFKNWKCNLYFEMGQNEKCSS